MAQKLEALALSVFCQDMAMMLALEVNGKRAWMSLRCEGER